MNADRRRWEHMDCLTSKLPHPTASLGGHESKSYAHPFARLRPSAFICGFIGRIFALVAMLLGPAGAAHAAEVTVFAAASLTDAFQQLGPRFARAHPGTKV